MEKTLSQGTTHILVGKTTRLSRIPNLLKVKSIPEGVLILRADWLSTCLVEAEMVGHGAYVVHPEPSPTALPNKDSPSQVSPEKVSSTLPVAVSTPPKPKETVTPSQATKPSPSTATDEGLAGESKSVDLSPSKMPTTPTRPAASLTSPKVTMVNTFVVQYITVDYSDTQDCSIVFYELKCMHIMQCIIIL